MRFGTHRRLSGSAGTSGTHSLVLLKLVAAAALATLPRAALAQVFVPDPLPAPIASAYTLELTEFATHTGSHAIDVASPRDGSGNVYVSTQSGQIFGYDADGNSLGLFIDLAGTAATTGFENPGAFVPGVNGAAFRGLMYFDFHPDFGTPGAAGEGRVYTTFESAPSFGVADYTAPSPGNHYVIAEWQVSGSDPNALDVTSYREVMRLAMSGSNPHAIGEIAFNSHSSPGDGDYGLLYAAIGDAGSTGNVAPAEGYIQEINNPFGKIIRIDPLDPDGAGPQDYSIPAGNPFVGVSGAAEENYALGFRDPQTFSFAKDANDETVLVTFDIGATQREEVNLVRPGQNYGWVRFEGTLGPGEFVPIPSTPENDGFYRERPLFDEENTIPAPPVLEYDHISGGFAIAGGLVVTDPNDADFRDQVIFGDLVRGRIFHADYEEVLAAERSGTQATIYESQVTFDGNTGTFADVLDGIDGGRGDARFGTDEAGNVYIVSKRTGVVFATGLIDASAGPFAAPSELVLTINRDTGEVVLTNASDSVNAVIDGYQITSSNGLLEPGGWSSLADAAITGWEEAPSATANGLAEFSAAIGEAFELTPGASISLGAAYATNLFAAMQSVGFGAAYEDVEFEFSDDATDTLRSAAVEYVGDERINNLVLEVDTETGQARLINQSALDIAIDAVQFTSASGSLDASYDGLTVDGLPVSGWESVPGGDASGLAQLFPAVGGFTVGAGAEFDLGVVLLANGEQDLEFVFVINGSFETLAGVVAYIDPAALPGDFNGDGVVDAIDYAVWRASLGQQEGDLLSGNGDGGTVDSADLSLWIENYGRSGPDAVATPELNGCVIATILLSVSSGVRFRRKRLVKG